MQEILRHKVMSLGEHLEELRSCLIRAGIGLCVAMCVAFALGKWVVDFLAAPYRRMMLEFGNDATLAVLKPAGGVLIYCRVCLYVAIVIASPWILYQLWRFVGAGLYKRERRMVMRVVPFSAGLFVGGALFFYFVVSGFILRFFHEFNNWLGLREVITLQDYIAFITSMMLVFGLAFQLPLVVWTLASTGIVGIDKFRYYRRHVIVGLLILSAACTSPSPVDQILLAVPMWLLYELGIFLAAVSLKKKSVA